MSEDERFAIVRRLLLDHISQPSERRVRDGLAVHMLAGEILERLDRRTGVWRKWNQDREDLLRSASQCWIPLEAMRAYLNGMPGPELTRMDVAQRLRAFQEEAWERYPDEHFRAGCLEIFERETTEGTELPAIIGCIREWLEDEEARRWLDREAARKRAIEEEKAALEQRLVSGADCKWTPWRQSPALYCRSNGRLFRLSPRADRRWELHRLRALEDEAGDWIGTYGTRGDAGRVVKVQAYAAEPRQGAP